MEHDNKIGESVKEEYDYEIDIALKIEDLNDNNSKKLKDCL